MKVLVTGGAGFIGSHVVKALLEENYSILVIDKQILPNSLFAQENLEKKVTFAQMDLRNKASVFTFIKKYKPPHIFHLAAQTLVTQAYRHPLATLNTNIMTTVNILEAARESGYIQSIIVASSDKAYGKTSRAYTEDAPLRGDHPYDVSKASTDLIAQAYFKTYRLPVVITRFGNVYGEGDLYFDRIIPGICQAIIKRKTLAIRSDGKYVRDYIYVKDVANGYMFLLKQGQKVNGEAYNFSSPETLSVLELIKKVEKTLAVKIPYKIYNTVQNEIPYQHLDDKKIRKLGWRNRYDLKGTLGGILRWYEKLF